MHTDILLYSYIIINSCEGTNMSFSNCTHTHRLMHIIMYLDTRQIKYINKWKKSMKCTLCTYDEQNTHMIIQSPVTYATRKWAQQIHKNVDVTAKWVLEFKSLNCTYRHKLIRLWTLRILCLNTKVHSNLICVYSYKNSS